MCAIRGSASCDAFHCRLKFTGCSCSGSVDKVLADDAVPADDKKALVQDGKDLFEGGHFEEAILAFGAELTPKIKYGKASSMLTLHCAT